jgi:3-oxoacyl-[acyl-carrier protein] reductase
MKKVLITGSGRRLGKSLAIEFARRNWDVILHFNNSKEMAKKTQAEIIKLGVNCDIFQCDISNISEIELIFSKVFKDFGTPDVLINNAGIFPPQKDIFNISFKDVENSINTNTLPILFISKEFAKSAKDNSRIINIHSLGAVEIWKNRIDYNMSKSAALTLTKSIARELAPKISVNAINPGHIEMEEKASDSTKNNLDNIPMKRYANVNDIFDAVYFFATCSNYITGQYLNIDGGYHDCR